MTSDKVGNQIRIAQETVHRLSGPINAFYSLNPNLPTSVLVDKNSEDVTVDGTIDYGTVDDATGRVFANLTNDANDYFGRAPDGLHGLRITTGTLSANVSYSIVQGRK